MVGTEVPETFSGETLQLADLLGDQFDCLSVSAREGAVLVTADLRLRQVAAAICTLPAFGLERTDRGNGEAGGVGGLHKGRSRPHPL